MPDALSPDRVRDPVADFLATSPAAGWSRQPLAGDASTRRYERLLGPDGRRAILMDARAEPASIPPFLRIGAHLRSLGLRAPAVLAEGDGLLVLEDLGSTTLAAWLVDRPGDAHGLYATALAVMARYQDAPPPEGLVALHPARAAGMVAPFFDHYHPGIDPRLAAELVGGLKDALETWAPHATVLSLRDFHAENLVWRPEREGLDRLGLLDFQDAVLAPPEYDLASLLRDARRDTDAELRAAMLRRFATLTGREEARVAAAAAVLGVQRNLRILGIFARLAREKGKAGYLALLPRVRTHVIDDLRHPALNEIATVCLSLLDPRPGPA